ncbi:RNA 2',3'-cyclic phosphodiesterase [Ruixingdingia sedimenti]|uniref:RNA 2',3'-cyclic phosphodiesterase n=1 Tax=Ruixingdingia sedimenti TaxID=3073604 RepID=A0ABU1F4B9_9RHOB|nr:RNA 2',3'-cyclic phosphodiesterase [Xinfangfangia sp. LG-4]MDR5651659.1 RNA 2',3'-cyclic phosphodiesterase [Xinfangfangia sp. LG-4]
MIRAFIALPLPEATRRQLTLIQFLLPLPRRVEPEGFHLTLCFLGDLPEPVVQEVHHALEAVAAAPFVLRLRGLGMFGGTRPRLVYAAADPDPALAALQRKVETAARRAGAAPESHRFVPHVTLGRFAPPPPETAMRIERAVAEGGGFACDPVQADAFALFRSHPGPSGSHYEELARYPLRGALHGSAD